MSEKVMLIREFRLQKNEDNTIRASCKIQNDDDETEIWFELSKAPHDIEIESVDAFFAPCLLLGLKSNSRVVFEIPISESIADQAADLAYVFGTQLGLNRKLEVEAANPIAVHRQANGAITGFSAGVDSWFALKQNLIECNLPSRKLTHLLVNDVGANIGNKKKQQVISLASDIAREFQLGLMSVKSNMNNVLQLDFQMTHTARNASVAHLLASIAGTFYYSSTDTYDDAGVFPTYDMAYADTIILPLLSTDSITLRSSGSAYSRAEKTRAILSIPQIGERLDVCVNHEHAGTKINCGVCWKCCRTELTLEAFGALDEFEPVFDLEAYGRRRSRYIQEISASHKPTEREVFNLARKAGLAGPAFFHQVQWTGIKSMRRLKNALKKSLQQISFRR